MVATESLGLNTFELARPVQRASMRGQVAAELQRLIVSGALAVGSPLPSEAQLGRTFGCSRSVVREALRDVEQLGLVERAGNGRLLIVQPGSLDKVSHAVHLYMELERVTFDELFQCLELLDPTASRLAAEAGDGATVEALAALNDEPRLTFETLPLVEVEFHLRLAEASGNRLFVAAWKPILDALAIAVGAAAPLLGTPAVTGTRRAHAEVIRAIADNDPERAAAWSRRHCAAFRGGWSALGKSAEEPVRPVTHLSGRSAGR